MFITLRHPFLFVTLRWKGYVHHVVTSIYFFHTVTLVYLWWHEYVQHNAMTRLSSSDCNKVRFITLQCVHMFIRFQCYYIRHILISIYVHPIATTGICSLHCDVCICLSHCDITMFAMTYICSSHCNERDMFIKLWQQGYVHHIATSRYFQHILTLLCLSHHDILFFITLRWKGYVHHIATSVYVCHIMKLLCLQC